MNFLGQPVVCAEELFNFWYQYFNSFLLYDYNGIFTRYILLQSGVLKYAILYVICLVYLMSMSIL